MSYLHQHRVCHGRLKSLNCVVDDRWVCKITGNHDNQHLGWGVDPAEACFRPKDRCPNARLSSVLPDYGLRTYRRGDGTETASPYQQRLVEVYLAPELANSSVEPTLAGDVFRWRPHTPEVTLGPGLTPGRSSSSYSIILLEIATRSDPVPVSPALIGRWLPERRRGDGN